MELSGKTKINDILTQYPFLLEFFINRSPKFKMLQSTMMRKTVGKVAPLAHVANIAGIDLDVLLEDIALEIRANTGQEVIVLHGEEGVEVEAEAPLDPARRQEVLKGIIRDLHAGVDMTILKHRFHDLVRNIEATEITRMEQSLIAEGMPESEIKRLCDIHVEVFKESLATQEVPSVPPGHPLHTYMKENRGAEERIEKMRRVLQQLCETPDRETFIGAGAKLTRLLEDLGQINLHYLRKENQLFPVLELREISAPTAVMWGIHDDIRQMLKYGRAQVAEATVPLVYETLRALMQSIGDMIYKEEHILFPMALEMLTDDDWLKVRRGEEEIGYAWVWPDAGWMPEGAGAAAAAMPEVVPAGTIALETGALSPELVNLMLTHLPVDITFVNEKDEVLYYSQSKERIFPRSPGVIGRTVQNCHPPKSLHVVQRMLDEFRAGTRDSAEFWIQMNGAFVHIRYFAVRDAQGAYRGTVEVTQDVTAIRRLEGERRLLD